MNAINRRKDNYRIFTTPLEPDCVEIQTAEELLTFVLVGHVVYSGK